MQKKFKLMFILGVVASLFVSFGFLIPKSLATVSPPFTINSGYSTTAPTIDGTLEALWDTKTKNYTWHQLLIGSDAYIYFLNNDTHLFLFVDVVPDTFGNPGSFFYLWLDTNNSKEITSGIFFADCFLVFNLALGVTGSNPSNLVYAVQVGFTATPNSAVAHTTLEIAIDMRSMFSPPSTGDTIGFLMAYDQTADSVPDEYLPFNFYTGIGGSVLENDESTYAELRLGAPIVPPTPSLEDLILGVVWILTIVLAVGVSVGATIGISYLLRRYLGNGVEKTFPYKLKK